jgi:hypothetical protein
MRERTDPGSRAIDGWGNWLAVAVIIGFGVSALVRLYPYPNMLASIVADTGNDWSGYAISALDIRHHGLLMPVRPAPYVSPAS